MRIKRILLFLGLMIAAMVVGNGDRVFAINQSDLTTKVLLRGLEKCYEDKYIPSGKQIDGTTKPVELDDIFSESGKKEEEDTIKVFSKELGNTLTQDVPAVSCKQLFDGYSSLMNGSIKGLFSLTGKAFDISQMGFHTNKNNTNTKKECLKIHYKYNFSNKVYEGDSNELCFLVEESNQTLQTVYDNTIGIVYEQGTTPTVNENSANAITATIQQPSGNDTFRLNISQSNGASLDMTCNGVDFLNMAVDFNGLLNCFKTSFENQALVSNRNDTNGAPITVQFEAGSVSVVEKPISSGGVGNIWEKDASGAAVAALKYYGGYDKFDDLVFSEQEKYDVLNYYIDQVRKSDTNLAVVSSSCYDTADELGNNVMGVIMSDGKWCELTGWEAHKDEKFNVIKNVIANDRQALKTVTFEELLERLKKINVSSIKVGAGFNAGSNTADEEDNCRNAGGAGALAWAICPILTIMGDAAEGIYTDVIDPLLVIEPTLFGNAKGGKDTRDAWETFRDIANVLFIILFLVVIFSQLTGIGIDNYGIKKILPRLIVAAVLINLSYLICLLLVDLSNILGVGLKGIFDTLGEKLNTTINLPSGVTTSGGGTTFSLGQIFASVGIVGIVGVLVGVAVWANPAIVLSMLVSVLGVFVAMLFLFLLLGARKALIIILTVISPLAVVAYMLPNTKRLFERWWKLLEGLLLVYPIAGLMIGAGNYASKLLLQSADGFSMWIIAMVVGIAPIFFIPIVLKGAFSAMGKVGGMLAGMGDSARKGVTGLARNSERFQTAQRMGKERNNRIKAGLDKNGVLTGRGQRRLKRLNRLSRVPVVRGLAGGMTKRQASLMAQARKDIDASEDAAATLSGALATSGISKSKAISDLGFEAGTESAYYGGQFLEAASKGNITAMNAAIEAMRRSNMKPKDIARVIRKAENDGSIKLNDENKAAWARDMSKKYGGDFLSTDYELSHFLRTGAKGNGGVLGDYGTYASAAIKNEDINPEELMRLSGDSLAGMAAAGKISQEMAQRVLASNPNLSDDKKIMFGALADGSASEASIGGIHNYKKFKDDATKLVNNRNAAGISTISGSNLPAKVSEWTRPTTQKVEVVNAGSPTPGGPGGGSS